MPVIETAAAVGVPVAVVMGLIKLIEMLINRNKKEDTKDQDAQCAMSKERYGEIKEDIRELQRATTSLIKTVDRMALVMEKHMEDYRSEQVRNDVFNLYKKGNGSG